MYKGAILAAGRGQRLQALTKTRPKPLLNFAGVPLLYLAAWRLHKLGIDAQIVNAHYLWEQVVHAVASLPLPVQVSLSLEKKELLGTGGCYARFHALRNGADLVVLNGDIVSDFPLADLLAAHEAVGAHASMALLAQPHPGESPVWAAGGRVVAIGGSQPPATHPEATAHGFACMQVLSDAFLRRIKEERPSSVIDFYRQALSKGEVIAACIGSAFWHDLGTPEQYLRAHKDFLGLWQTSPFSSTHDPLGVLAMQKLCKRSLHFVGTDQYIGDEVKIIAPCLLAEDFSPPAHSRIGPYVYGEDALAWTTNSPYELSESLLLSGASIPNSPASGLICAPASVLRT